MAKGTTINIVTSFVGGSITINNSTRTNIAPENEGRIRLDISLDCDDDDHCIKFYDAETGGQFIGLLDRLFVGVMIRNRDFFTMDKNAIYQGDVWAFIEDGATDYDILVTEFIA